ncbi:hypothetical protein MKQ70_36505 [Chitinophaga sedimenti]|uniref:hypothetical protein n=1 Tax=Chitinophaga sedimenti TaxID=2033606 RepID=UPI002003540F|nr:hypothetical protein [Chitinophaga sedimenti]MCK7560128.1 hypothetical protein [Chitinophaga sedimenti]
MLTPDYKRFVDFRHLKAAISDGKEVDVKRLVADNPEYYHAYVLAGDYLFKRARYREALPYYKAALTKVIATKPEENHIRKRIEEINKK